MLKLRLSPHVPKLDMYSLLLVQKNDMSFSLPETKYEKPFYVSDTIYGNTSHLYKNQF